MLVAKLREHRHHKATAAEFEPERVELVVVHIMCVIQCTEHSVYHTVYADATNHLSFRQDSEQ